MEGPSLGAVAEDSALQVGGAALRGAWAVVVVVVGKGVNGSLAALFLMSCKVARRINGASYQLLSNGVGVGCWQARREVRSPREGVGGMQ